MRSGPGRARRERYATLHARVQSLEGSLEELRERAGARDRELDLLQFELAEIDAAEPSEAEELELTARRDRLRHVEALRGAALGAAEAVVADEGGVAGVLSSAGVLLDGVDGVDSALDALSERWRALAIEADDLAADLRVYGEGLEAEGGDLDAIEERLAAWDRLKRKHGGTIASVLAHADECRARVAELDRAEVALEEAQAALAEATAARGALALELRKARVKAAKTLAVDVRGRLAELADGGGDPRDRAGRARRQAPPAPTPSSSSSRPTRACRQRRCARPPRAASCRASCWP